MPVAIVTGGSRGLGMALGCGLAGEGWSVVIDARDERELEEARRVVADSAGGGDVVRAVVGDVTDDTHRKQLVAAAEELGGLDLLVNNASSLGPSPLPALAQYPIEALRAVFEVNVIASLALVRDALDLLLESDNPRLINVTSDASVEAYEGWGGYGSSKAALDHLGAVLAVEQPRLRVWTVDPGDMRTRMHQEAFPGEDISDRPLPETVVPSLLHLVASDLPSGRYKAAELSLKEGYR